MPKTTAPRTADELRNEAERLDAEARALRQELQRQAQEADERRRSAQQAWDERFAAGFSRAAVEADVDQAKAALDEALAANPLVAALADYLTALRRRSWAVQEQMSVLGRLGRPAGLAPAGPTELGPLNEYVIRAAERMASDRVAAELAERAADREAVGDAAAEVTG